MAYPAGTQTDYLGAASGAYRITRGGSWNLTAPYCTVASQNYYFGPNLQAGDIGFRVVRN